MFCVLSMILTLVETFLNFKELQDCEKVSCKYDIKCLIGLLLVVGFLIMYVHSNLPLIMSSDFYVRITFLAKQ